MKIIDAFVYGGERQVLKMRLALHYDLVDEIWISEGDRTFQGEHKGYTFLEEQGQFVKWLPKIHYISHVVKGEGLGLQDDALNFSAPAWSAEHAQRNALKECLEGMKKEDLVLLSDVDEFVSPQLLHALRESRGIDVARLQMLNHYYFMNCQGIGENKYWYAPLLVNRDWWEQEGDISTFRHAGQAHKIVERAGWHFSYLGGAEAIEKKLSSFSHTEMGKWKGKENLERSVELGVDYAGREGHEYAFLPVERYPAEIQDLMRKNRNFVRWSL